jgi:hypothetical protein
MNKTEFQSKKAEVENLATKYNWRFQNMHFENKRVSFLDETGYCRIDVFLSKMTFLITKKGQKPQVLKNQTMKQLEDFFKNPYK